jgi:hypothetical protein
LDLEGEVRRAGECENNSPLLAFPSKLSAELESEPRIWLPVVELPGNCIGKHTKIAEKEGRGVDEK